MGNRSKREDLKSDDFSYEDDTSADEEDGHRARAVGADDQ